MAAGFETTQQLELISMGIVNTLAKNPTSLKRVAIKFTDLNNDYGETSTRIRLTGTDAIKAQVRNILSTPIGSEAFEPEFGSMLPFRLFEPITSLTAWQIENDTVSAISRWMRGRINVNRSQCKAEAFEREDAAGYYIRLVYNEIETGEAVTYSFFVSR